MNYSGNAGAGADIGGNYFTGYGQDGVTPVFGGGVSLGIGAGAGGAEGVSFTGILPFN